MPPYSKKFIKLEKHSNVICQIFGFNALKAHEITDAEIISF